MMTNGEKKRRVTLEILHQILEVLEDELGEIDNDRYAPEFISGMLDWEGIKAECVFPDQCRLDPYLIRKLPLMIVDKKYTLHRVNNHLVWQSHKSKNFAERTLFCATNH